jgi:hypothetical protein
MENALGDYANLAILIGLAVLIGLGLILLTLVRRVSARTKVIREQLKDVRAAIVVMRAELGSQPTRRDDDVEAAATRETNRSP